LIVCTLQQVATGVQLVVRIGDNPVLSEIYPDMATSIARGSAICRQLMAKGATLGVHPESLSSPHPARLRN
jgi:hypothetical protein